MDTASIVTLIIILAIVVAVAAGAFLYPAYRRRQLDKRGFPDSWLAIVKDRLPIYMNMTAAQQLQLKQLITRFLAGRDIVGCAGLEITDEIRVTIAAHACLLLLNRPTDEYEGLRTVLVYPGSFRVERDVFNEAGIVTQGSHILSGESWSTGRIILSWDNVAHGVDDFSDGYNVVLHEFAHQLDHQSGVTNGAPVLSSRAAGKSWARVFSEEFAQLQQASENHLHTLIDQYGATDPAEFFAVVTETFYEKPQQLAARHPELFEQLKIYYQIDPRDWHQPGQ
jgi:MtfA peptidase